MKERLKRLGGENKEVGQENTHRRRREPRRNGGQQYSRANTSSFLRTSEMQETSGVAVSEPPAMGGPLGGSPCMQEGAKNVNHL